MQMISPEVDLLKKLESVQSHYWSRTVDREMRFSFLTKEAELFAFFLPLLATLFPPDRSSGLSFPHRLAFHDWDLVTRWAQLLITSHYYLPRTSKDQSTMKAELIRVIRTISCKTHYSGILNRSDKQSNCNKVVGSSRQCSVSLVLSSKDE